MFEGERQQFVYSTSELGRWIVNFIDNVENQLKATSERIKQLQEENDKLKKEIESLKPESDLENK